MPGPHLKVSIIIRQFDFFDYDFVVICQSVLARPYDLYCVGGDVKPCSINQSIWRGFINAEETNRLQSILNKTIRRSYLPLDFNSLDELLDSADHALFRVIVRNPHRVLHPLSLRAKELFTIYANLPMD